LLSYAGIENEQQKRNAQRSLWSFFLYSSHPTANGSVQQSLWNPHPTARSSFKRIFLRITSVFDDVAKVKANNVVSQMLYSHGGFSANSKFEERQRGKHIAPKNYHRLDLPSLGSGIFSFK
jgi:hypothetical protein